MTDSPLYAELSRLLSTDGAGARALHEMVSRHVTWDEFAASEHDGLSLQAAWNVTRLVKEAMSVHVPIPDLDGNSYWYTRTHQLTDAICRIQCLCRADGALFRQLHDILNRPVLVNSRVDETVAAALLDGLDVAGADVEEMLLLERTPRNDNERLVANTLSALERVDELANEPFSRDLLMHLRDLVLDGVDPEGLSQTQSRLGILQFEYPEERVRQHADKQLRYIVEYANNVSGEEHDHPVFRALLLPDVFRLYHPLPNANSQVGRLAFRLYTLKVGLPVLGMLPLSRTKLRWEEGVVPPALSGLAPRQYLADRVHQATDLTGYATLVVHLALDGLRSLQQQLADLEVRDAEVRELLQRDPEVNHRQRSILGRALRNPNAEFRIAYHRATHNVVYATARADLLELVERGYLVLGKDGRAMVFRPRKDLHEFIQHGYS